MPKLSSVVQKFILHWGEMGTRWGVNRTVAQVHALLYLSPHPLHAEDIANTLSVARSNVSTSLKELQSWGLVKIVHVMGDRRDHFESLKDVWRLFQVVMDERKRREIDPTLAVLRETVQDLNQKKPADAYTARQLGQMLEFFETTTACYGEIRRLPPGALRRLAKMGGKVTKLIGWKAG